MKNRLRILIIEDNRQYTKSLTHMIQLADRMEFVASYLSGEAYLEDPNKPTAGEIDIVLLDLQLPGKSGL